MKHISSSKLFVFGFVSLIFGTCSIPLFQALINFINKILFIIEFYFFYQLQLNLQILLFEEILPSLVLFWLFFEFLIHPGIVKLHFSRAFKIFINAKILRKEVGFITFNKKNNFNKTRASELKKFEDISSQVLPKITGIQYISNRWGLKTAKLNLFQNIFYYLKYFFNFFKSMFFSFSTIFHNFFLNISSFGRENF